MGTRYSSPGSSLCPEEEMEEQELLVEVAAWVGGWAAASLNGDGKGAKSRWRSRGQHLWGPELCTSPSDPLAMGSVSNLARCFAPQDFALG